MSNVNPGRRALRTTRTTTAKDIENATARPSRISTRAKPASSNAAASTAAAAASSKSRSTSVAPKAEALVGKRKREVLVEVTSLVANNRTAKGKQKEDTKKFEGVVLNKSRTLATRQPLRQVSTIPPSVKTEALDEISEQAELVENDENAMVVDHPSILPSLTIRKSLIPEDQIPRESRRSDARHHQSARSLHRVEEDPEANRVFKKRRTSSEVGEFAEEPEEDDTIASRVAEELSAFDAEVEADPNGDDWDDLDAEDADDPLMVSEYVKDIFEYFREIEVLTMPNPNYMSTQTELGWPMRGILADWLLQLHTQFRLLPETLFLAMNLIDRFLSTRVVSLAKLQLVGVTAMFIAAKVEEVVAPGVDNFLDKTDGSYTKNEMFKAERYILHTLGYNLSYPNPIHYLRRISKADDYNPQVRTLGKYLTEIACLEWRLIATPPSLLAASAMWLARLVLGYETWTPNLAHYSMYSETQLIPTANLMLNYIIKPIRHEAFYKKYAGKRCLKVSVFMRQWVLERWSETEQINLRRDLPTLKLNIRTQRIESQILREDEEQVEEILDVKPAVRQAVATTSRSQRR
ncbi:cyclin-like protein [Mycena floridula]|nr:cyclin-like protein [Mycena floridula]